MYTVCRLMDYILPERVLHVIHTVVNVPVLTVLRSAHRAGWRAVSWIIYFMRGDSVQNPQFHPTTDYTCAVLPDRLACGETEYPARSGVRRAGRGKRGGTASASSARRNGAKNVLCVRIQFLIAKNYEKFDETASRGVADGSVATYLDFYHAIAKPKYLYYAVVKS